MYKDRSDSIVAFHFFNANVSVDGESVEAGVSVAEDSHGNLFYNLNHDTDALWEKIKPQNLDRFYSRADDGAQVGRNRFESEARLSDLNMKMLSSGGAVNSMAKGGGSSDNAVLSRDDDPGSGAWERAKRGV